MLPKIEFKMAAKFKVATKIKFACENYKSSFFKKLNSGLFQLPVYLSFLKNNFSKIQDGPYIQHGDFFAIFF
jgi:hypothetical protein